MPTYRLIVEYDGRAFHGFQAQLNLVTVQSALEAALSVHFDTPRVIVHGSGRTDAGVHALGQVVTFRVANERDPNRLRMGLNTALPPELSIVAAELVPEGFHARFSATGKTYRYRLYDRGERSPFLTGFALHRRRPLDWASIEAAIPALVGTHDYSTFRGAGCTAKSPVRTVDRAEVVHVGAHEHQFEFHGNGFLRYQVRRMVGTLIEVGERRRAPEDVAAALAARDPRRSGRTARPEGLYLVSVDYPPESLVFTPPA